MLHPIDDGLDTATGERVHIHRTPLFLRIRYCIQRIAIEVDHFGGIFSVATLSAFQFVVDLRGVGCFYDFLVHQRLGCAARRLRCGRDGGSTPDR